MYILNALCSMFNAYIPIFILQYYLATTMFWPDLVYLVFFSFCFFDHRQPKRTMCGFGLQRSFGRNIVQLFVYCLLDGKKVD